MKPGPHIGGIVLAAGASSRMGSPKALLPMPDERPLAAYQADLLARAGCSAVVIVLGSDAERVARRLERQRVAVNADWPSGRFSSVQTGLRALPPCAGYILLPVDTIGVSTATVELLLQHASTVPAEVLRPAYRGQPGRLVWLSRRTADALQALPPQDLALDDFLAPHTALIEVADAAILSNVNTPEEWQRWAGRPAWKSPPG